MLLAAQWLNTNKKKSQCEWLAQMNTKYFNKNTPSFRKPKTLLGAHVKDAQEVGNCRGVDDIYLSALAKLMGIPSCITTIQSLKWMGLRESTKWGGGGGQRFSRDCLPDFHAEGHCEQFWHEHGCPLFDGFHPAFPLPTTASPTLQDSLKDGLREGVVAFDMPKPYAFHHISPPVNYKTSKHQQDCVLHLL